MLVLLAILAGLSFPLSACDTMEELGQDVENAGEAVGEEAEENT
jgi:predicted small secreted protein